MKNPFEYGIIVGGAAFCNRKQELADMVRAMENSEKLFLYSERRLGKTSLIKLAQKQLSENEFAIAYIDLWPTDGELSFVTATAKGITESIATTADHLLTTAKRFFARLAPSVTLDENGNPSVIFGISPSALSAPDLEEVLSVPAKIAAETKRKVVVIFDEVQRILEYGDDQVERRLRSIIQQQENVGYIFLGSRKHLVQEMFLNRTRPLYRSAGHYPLGPIAEIHWRPFIRSKFESAGKIISDPVIEEICQLTEGHPFYTQHLCHALWENCEPGQEVAGGSIEAGLHVLLARESYAYTALWESLSINQRRLLKGLALEGKETQLFSTEFALRYGLGTASNVQRAVKSLLKRDLIDRDLNSFVFGDRFFRIWIRELQGHAL